MNSKAIYTEPVNRIKQAVLFDEKLDRISMTCSDIADFYQELAEWGIYTLGGVNFDSLTQNEIQRLDQFMVNQNGYEDITEEN
tara:strand:+ start:869 stop:1117 length:249 start_codon:yes stop_codon:yes gene_type:complete